MRARFSLDPQQKVLLDSGMLRLVTRFRFHALACVLAATLACAPSTGCGDDDDGADGGDGHGDQDAGDCLADLSLDCKPTFEPATYDAIFQNVLRPTCGSAGTGRQCHSEEGMMAGLVLQEHDEAYDSLLGKLDGRARVVKGKPECSILVQRLESTEKRLRMPLNSDPLDEGLRCAIRLWIAAGAEP